MMPPDPLTHAIALARAGKHTEARAILLKIIETEPANETAWMWLVLVLPTTNQRIAALDQWLAINPDSEKARQGLERLRSPSVKAAQPDETQPPVPPPPPRDIVSSTPAEPIPTQTVPAETRPHSPWILGKAAPEDKPEASKTGLMERFRRKENPPQNEETEIDLGIAGEPDEKNLTSAVSRVFTTNIDGTDINPAQESGSLAGKEENLETENGDDSVLDQLRGKVGKKKTPRPTTTARSLIRVFLFLFYLAVFIGLGYLGWKRYGVSISTALLSGWNQQSNTSPAQPVENEQVSTPPPGPTPSPSPEITAVAAPTDTPVPVIGERPAEDLGLVAYSATSAQGDQDLFTIPPEGGEPTNWTSAVDGAVGDPTLSTDGRLVYSLNGKDLYQIDAQGSTRKLTSDGSGNREPAWSPDDTRIAYVSDRDGNPEIYIMNADGSESIRVTDQAGSDISPAWSPDGTRIAFVSNRDGPFEIYTTNADGTGVLRLTYDLAKNNSPNWSPDSRWIAYSGNRSGDHEIYSLSPDGSQLNRLTFSPGADENPVWSPDGYWILFTSDRDQAGLSNLYAMVRDGSRTFADFKTPPKGILSPAWSRK